VEHESRRDGALHLFAAGETRTGHGYGQGYSRKRHRECMACLASRVAEMPRTIKTIQIVCDKVATPHGKAVCPWWQRPPRFVCHRTPGHCSWMHQVEQWFSIRQRKRLRIAAFVSKAALQTPSDQFIVEWNQVAHPCNWSTKSVAKIMADAPAKAA